MPTYLYQCPSCGRFEEEQSISQPALQHCPTCGEPVRRLITGGTGFIMKGRGAAGSHCESGSPCCGRETRCDRPPCGK
ncbi:MAG: zinc ribbon domain-containing protein [Bradymonadales bacterium]|nr:zinc ribbon domain-containing protein [Bradymonadales bacterium]